MCAVFVQKKLERFYSQMYIIAKNTVFEVLIICYLKKEKSFLNLLYFYFQIVLNLYINFVYFLFYYILDYT